MKFLVIQKRSEKKLNGPHITSRAYVFALLQGPLTNYASYWPFELCTHYRLLGRNNDSNQDQLMSKQTVHVNTVINLNLSLLLGEEAVASPSIGNIFMARFNDVHVSGYNSAGSKLIWIKFWVLRVYCSRRWP